jgi:hypothetical protein
MNAKKASACEAGKESWSINEEIDPEKWDQKRFKEIQHKVICDIDVNHYCSYLSFDSELIDEAFKKNSYTRKLLTQICAGSGVKLCDALMYLKAGKDACYDFYFNEDITPPYYSDDDEHWNKHWIDDIQ